jgi:glycosyltransferase involved in cell wall biosynthesis
MKIIGKLGWDEKMRATLQDGSPKTNLEYTGFLSEKKKLSVIKNSKFSIFASFYEGFGLPVLESMAFGVPVVCSISSSLPEILGDLGVYFDPYSVTSFHDALSTIDKKASDPTYRKALWERANSFSWDPFLTALSEI